MFPELNNLLNITPDKVEQGKLTLLCDAKTDGSFLVHHFLSFFLKAKCKVCFVALVQSFSHYNIVGQKLGVSLTTAWERGQLVFLEALKTSLDIFFQTPAGPHPLQFLREASARNLQPLYAFVQEALKPEDGGEATWRHPVLLVDDLSVLLSLGVRAVAVLDFIHYCRATVCTELKGNLVALVHDSGDAADEENDLLVSGLSHQSHLILRAEGLATGFCKDVHGQASPSRVIGVRAACVHSHMWIQNTGLADSTQVHRKKAKGNTQKYCHGFSLGDFSFILLGYFAFMFL
ncbi:PREDICTED: elongator complex protein 6 isoform X2 [Chinchilla lanigera]|uniref:elongator complex protein 6 isoform X2 n=1 Tax=Chinchilla lanigera TaxID=34839 RepID=UPI00038EBC5D|nr:PREDICTED: elongator complex protein 6 isoform X2 [Chinchilla lanigera]